MNCSVGTYASSTASSLCVDCDAGRIAEKPGSSTCTDCDAGRIAAATGSSVCAACDPGTYAGATGLYECSQCLPEYFQPDAAQSLCLKCSSDIGSEYTSIAHGSQDCSACVPLYFMDDDDRCQLCPDGVDCSKVGSTLRGLELELGWWRTSWDSANVLRCHAPEACVGGNSTDSYCEEGYESYYCASCAEGYYGFETSCLHCGEESMLAIILFVVMAGIVVMFAVVLWVHKDQIKAKLKGNNTRVASTAKILLSFCLILVAMQDTFNLTWPFEFSWFVYNIMAWLSLGFISSLAGLECVVENSFYDGILLKTLIPIFIGLILAVIANVCSGASHKGPGDRNKVQEKCFTAALWLSYLILSSVSKSLFSIYNCESFDDGETMLKAAYDIPCSGGIYDTYYYYGGLMVLVYPIGL